MFGLLGSIAKTAINVVTLPIAVVDDIAHAAPAVKTEKQVVKTASSIKDIFNPLKW